MGDPAVILEVDVSEEMAHWANSLHVRVVNAPDHLAVGMVVSLVDPEMDEVLLERDTPYDIQSIHITADIMYDRCFPNGEGDTSRETFRLFLRAVSELFTRA